MVLEVVVLSIRPEEKARFEQVFTEARKVLSSADGFIAHELQRCVETDGRYLLWVQWASIEHHVKGFRESPLFTQWRALLVPYFTAPSQVEHYELVSRGGPHQS